MCYDLYDDAAALFDGGWRASDRNQMISEYDLSDEQADAICEWLAAFEDDGGAE